MASRRCSRVPCAVAASESAMAWRSVAGTRSRRPIMLRRTPSSTQWVVSVRRYSWSSRRMPLTSAAGRFQFAEESAKSVSVRMPRRGAASMMRRADSAPARWPAERGSPREVAQRPLPSEMMATCRPGLSELSPAVTRAEAGAAGREAGIGTTCEHEGTERVFSNEMGDSIRVSSLRRKEKRLLQNPFGTALQTTLHCKANRQNFLPLSLPCSSNQRFHMIEIAFQGLASRSRQAIFRLGRATLEGFGANDVLRLFQLSCVDAQVPVGRFQQSFQFVKRERAVHRERADDAEANVF